MTHPDAIQWQDFEVIGGHLSRNEWGQYSGVLTLANGHQLSLAFDRFGAKWGWQPTDPPFVVDRTEEP